MKPLELHIYDKHPDADAYRVGGFYSPYCLVSRDKRFTGAELAAEWQHSRLVSYVRYKRHENDRANTVLYDHYERGLDEEWTLERFATLPHYDEADQ